MSWLADPALRRRLGIALGTFAWVTALIVTLYPFRFSLEVGSPSRIDWRLYYPHHNDRDLIQNLLMLVPLGVALALVRFGRVSLWRLALEAAALSLGTAILIESLQVFESARFPQLADVWRNGAGAIAGALATAVVLRQLAGITARRSAPR